MAAGEFELTTDVDIMLWLWLLLLRDELEPLRCGLGAPVTIGLTPPVPLICDCGARIVLRIVSGVLVCDEADEADDDDEVEDDDDDDDDADADVFDVWCPVDDSCCTGVLEEFVVVVDEELEEEEGDGEDWSIATELVATVATLGAISCDETILVGGGDDTNRLVRFCATGVVEMVVTFVEIVDGLSGVDGM